LRLEGLKINLGNTSGIAGGIKYATHVQNDGWQAPVSISTTGASSTIAKGGLSGTQGRALRLEAVTIELTGALAKHCDIYYRVHAENVGWMGWAKNGECAGTAGHALRLEALQIVIVAKGGAAPANNYGNITTIAGTPRMIDPSVLTKALRYDATVHAENIGNLSYGYNASGSTQIGTIGRALRLEALSLNLASHPAYEGSIEYATHVQNYGWQPAVRDGKLSGTQGKGLRLEAVTIKLTGAMAAHYDVYYRCHIQSIGWTGWAKNGQQCGSAGYGYRMEAMQIALLPKGEAAPGLTANYFYKR
jgi:uncharacterized protein YjdB